MYNKKCLKHRKTTSGYPAISSYCTAVVRSWYDNLDVIRGSSCVLVNLRTKLGGTLFVKGVWYGSGTPVSRLTHTHGALTSG